MLKHGGRAAPGTTKSRSLWRNHDFMLLWTGETVSTLGSSMSSFVFPVVGYALTGSTTRAALAGGAFSLGLVGSKLPAGVLVDRWNRRRVLIASNLLGGLLYASLAAAELAHALTLAHLVVVALLSGVSASFFGPAEQAAVKAVVPAEQLPTAFSQNQARQHVAVLVGPPVGGALFVVRAWAPFLLDAVTYLLSAVGLTRLRTSLAAPPRSGARGLAGVWQDTREGFHYLLGQGFLRAILAFACIANFSVNGLMLIVTLKLLRADVHPATIGLIDTMGAVAGLVGALLAPAILKRVPNGPLAIVISLVLAVAVVPMAFTDDPRLVGALLALALFGNPAGNASIMSYMAATTPQRLQGRATAALGFSAMILTPLAPVLGGAALAALGGRTAMLIAAGLTACAAIPLLLSRDVRHLPTPDKWPAPPPDDVVTPSGVPVPTPVPGAAAAPAETIEA